MFIIEKLPTITAECQSSIQAVADIEAAVQTYDAWTYQTLVSLLEQDSIKLLIIYDQQPLDTVNDRKVIGYCLYQMLFEQAEILRIGTHPHYQRQGIASQLFVELNNELQCSEVQSLLLEVRADNIPAIALYKQQNFAVIHTRTGYYQLSGQSAIDALIMQRVYI